jgi:hypothetical protein
LLRAVPGLPIWLDIDTCVAVLCHEQLPISGSFLVDVPGTAIPKQSRNILRRKH